MSKLLDDGYIYEKKNTFLVIVPSVTYFPFFLARNALSRTDFSKENEFSISEWWNMRYEMFFDPSGSSGGQKIGDGVSSKRSSQGLGAQLKTRVLTYWTGIDPKSPVLSMVEPLYKRSEGM